MKGQIYRFLLITALLAFLVTALGCDEPFDPRSQINSLRFLAVSVDPLEASPGQTMTFDALITDSNGSLYEGPVAWIIVTEDGTRTGQRESFDSKDAFLQTPDGPLFEWTVPEERELEELFGPSQERGRLITVVATAFKNGDVDGEPVTAFKTFIVSDRSPEQIFDNPAIAEFIVTESGGEEVLPNDEGLYVTDKRKVNFKAIPEENSDQLDYTWFVNSDEFEPENLSYTQNFRPDKLGRFGVYCVQRKSHFFESDAGERTRVAGVDWRRIDIRFE